MYLKKVKEWQYKDGVPLLKDIEIEGYAYEFVKKYSPISLNRYQTVPIIEIINKLAKTNKLNLKITNLGKTNGFKILGKTLLDKNTILIDEELYYANDKNFILRRTIAHELGHWTFHRRKKIKINLEGENIEEDNDFEYRLVDGNEVKVFFKDIDLYKDFKKILKTPVDFADHQAKVFAACVLLPKDVLIGNLISYQKSKGVTKNFGYIYLNDESSSMREFYDTLTHLKNTFDVSKISIEYRLTYLNRIKDTRARSKYTAKNLSNILSEF